MAHQWMRCNLSAAIYPFAKDLMGRTIIMPQFDQNYDRDIRAKPEGVEGDKGVPQAYYMHNCIPAAQGYQAVGYDKYIEPLAGVTDFDTAFQLQDPDANNFLFTPAAGVNYIFDATLGVWTSTSPFPVGTVPDDVIVTTAFVQGQTYIYYEKYGCYTYDRLTKTLVNVPLLGLTATEVNAICAANGYMIACDDTDVAWSNSTVPTDFVPSLVTGAGGGSVADAKGKIICVLPISGGFLIYCEKNVVSAKFTSNARFPYILNEIPGSGGITSPEQVSWQSNLGEHYAWTTVGLQKFTLTSAGIIFPEATDFLAGLLFEDFDESTLLFSVEYLTTMLSIHLAVISDRYAVISYGVHAPDYTHALVFDLALKRWGKFKIAHRDCFQWNNPNLYGPITYAMLAMPYSQLMLTTYADFLTGIEGFVYPKKALAFLQQDGTVYIVNFDLSESNANGVFMLGKFQFQRNKFLVHQSTDVENIRPSGAFSLYIVPSLNGKDLLTPVPGVLQTQGDLMRRYNKRLTGLNYSLLFIGAFNLTSVLTNFTLGGDR